MFVCPSASERIQFGDEQHACRLHYSSHPRLCRAWMTGLQAGSTGAVSTPAVLLTPYKIGSIRASSEIILIFDGSQIFQQCDGNAFEVATGLDQDGLYRQDTQQGRSWNNLISGNGTKVDVAVFTPNGAGTSAAQPTLTSAGDMCNDTANFLFVDGHADSIKLKKGVNADLKLRNLYVNPK